MALLPSFISFLNESELQSLRHMQLRGKEKEMLELILKSRTETGIDKKAICDQLHISSSHYDKINTVLLKKCYRHFSGENDLDQLTFLNKKQLFPHLFHEIRQLSAKSKFDQLSAEKKEEYAYAFYNLTLNVPARFLDEKLVNGQADLYLKNIISGKPAKELEVKSKLIFSRLNRQMQKPPDERAHLKLLQELNALEKKYQSVKEVSAKTVLYRVMVFYYNYLCPEFEKRNYYLAQIESLYRKEELPHFQKALSDCNKAEQLFEENKLGEAYVLYARTFHEYDTLLKNQFHHYSRFAELAMVMNELSTAQQVLDNVFLIYIQNKHESAGVLGSVLYAELCFKKGLYEKAFEYIAIGKSLNSLQVYFQYEIRLRMLETLYFAYSGDLEFASRLAQKNMRYIQLQKLSLKKYKYAHYFYLLKELNNIIKPLQGKGLSKAEGYLAEFTSGYDLLYGQLLHKIIYSSHPNK
ncbi:MAG: hypothetical protein H0W62_05225 [Chitinophagales bacterium]|nr:hypothetical protein [Chitinophagales bacterium]